MWRERRKRVWHGIIAYLSWETLSRAGHVATPGAPGTELQVRGHLPTVTPGVEHDDA